MQAVVIDLTGDEDDEEEMNHGTKIIENEHEDFPLSFWIEALDEHQQQQQRNTDALFPLPNNNEVIDVEEDILLANNLLSSLRPSSTQRSNTGIPQRINNNSEIIMNDDDDEVDNVVINVLDSPIPNRKRRITEVYEVLDDFDDEDEVIQVSESKRRKGKGPEEISGPASPFISEESDEKQECPICYDESVLVSFIHGCGHKFCVDCLRTYATDKMKSRSVPIICPMPDCKQEIELPDLRKVLNKTELSQYQDYLLQSFMENNPDQYASCITPDCGYMFAHDPVNDSPEIFCPKCRKHYCLRCKVDYHKGSSCEKYQEWLKENGQADTKFEEFAKNNRLKQCPKCRRWVEKSQGCDHMTCRCGAQFCYSCGGSYPCTQCRSQQMAVTHLLLGRQGVTQNIHAFNPFLPRVQFVPPAARQNATIDPRRQNTFIFPPNPNQPQFILRPSNQPQLTVSNPDFSSMLFGPQRRRPPTTETTATTTTSHPFRIIRSNTRNGPVETIEID